MSQNRLPDVKDPLADIADLAIKPMEELEETNRQLDEDEELLEPKQRVEASDVFKKYHKNNIILETKDELENNTDLSLPEDSLRGKRGKDKKKRKKIKYINEIFIFRIYTTWILYNVIFKL